MTCRPATSTTPRCGEVMTRSRFINPSVSSAARRAVRSWVKRVMRSSVFVPSDRVSARDATPFPTRPAGIAASLGQKGRLLCHLAQDLQADLRRVVGKAVRRHHEGPLTGDHVLPVIAD